MGGCFWLPSKECESPKQLILNPSETFGALRLPPRELPTLKQGQNTLFPTIIKCGDPNRQLPSQGEGGRREGGRGREGRRGGKCPYKLTGHPEGEVLQQEVRHKNIYKNVCLCAWEYINIYQNGGKIKTSSNQVTGGLDSFGFLFFGSFQLSGGALQLPLLLQHQLPHVGRVEVRVRLRDSMVSLVSLLILPKGYPQTN